MTPLLTVRTQQDRGIVLVTTYVVGSASDRVLRVHSGGA